VHLLATKFTSITKMHGATHIKDSSNTFLITDGQKRKLYRHFEIFTKNSRLKYNGMRDILVYAEDVKSGDKNGKESTNLC
jgi:hypothetical protein